MFVCANAGDESTAGGGAERRPALKKRSWRAGGRQKLESFPLAPWASRRRPELLELWDRFNRMIAELTQAVEQEAEKCPDAKR